MQKEVAFLSLPLLLLFICCSSSHGAVQDFCVADVSGPQSPAGYSCKNVGNVTVDDFVFSFGRKPGNTSNNLGLAIKTAFAPQYAGVNGLDISALRADMAPGGAVPIHSHPGSSELFVVFRGSVTAGFVSSNANNVYLKTLGEGETMVFPKGLLHFIVNNGKGMATVFSSFNSASPGLQLTSFALFQNNLPSELVEKVTFINGREVRRLKALLGGTG